MTQKQTDTTTKAAWWRRSLTKWQIKVVLTMIGVGIVVSVLLYTQNIVDQLIQREKGIVRLYAELMQNFVRTFDDKSNFFLEQVTPTITFPCIITDANDNPLEPFSQFSLNVFVDTLASHSKQLENMKKVLDEMNEYPVIDIKDANNIIISRIHYSNSALITKLRILPYIEIVIVTIFIGIGYIAFNYLKRNEESHIWVGMSKEAAHQLGTPLSSLLAWIEILRQHNQNAPPQKSEHDSFGISFEETVKEIEHDIERLMTIANRFSLIGSLPKRELQSIAPIIEKTINYYERRFPHLGKNITIERHIDSDIQAPVNPELLGWVFENLLKNAAEAIDKKQGIIYIEIHKLQPHSQTVNISFRDNGKGMSASIKKQIFLPGFTTKKRGWGLGLSLSKRIVEDYHKGKITIHNTEPLVGTTFLLELPITFS